jgi:putative transposase
MEIFLCKEDFEIFLKICSNIFKKIPFEVLAFCLMTNHYHFLIQTPEPNLPEIMRLINQKYAIYFNSKYKNVGHVFQGRYKAKIVENRSYLRQLVSYIHLNPLKAKLVTCLENWIWSSYPIICNQVIKPNFLNLNKLEYLLGEGNLINEVKKSNSYYVDFTEDQLRETLYTDLIAKVTKLSLGGRRDILLTKSLVKACLDEKICSSNIISKILGLSERYVRKIKDRL